MLEIFMVNIIKILIKRLKLDFFSISFLQFEEIDTNY